MKKNMLFIWSMCLLTTLVSAQELSPRFDDSSIEAQLHGDDNECVVWLAQERGLISQECQHYHIHTPENETAHNLARYENGRLQFSRDAIWHLEEEYGSGFAFLKLHSSNDGDGEFLHIALTMDDLIRQRMQLTEDEAEYIDVLYVTFATGEVVAYSRLHNHN